MNKKYKKLIWQVQKAEGPLGVLGSLQGAEKPTKTNAKRLEHMAHKTEITFTKKEIKKFDRDLSNEVFI